MPAEMTSPAALRVMLHRHPARREMRRQMLVEIVLLMIFLWVYYDFFDGDRRPWGVNALMVAAVGLVIVHNVVGYVFSRRAMRGDHLQEMVRQHVAAMRRFAVASVLMRVGMTVCVLVFLSYGIIWDTWKVWVLAGIVLVAAAQLAWLGMIWRRRIRAIGQALED